MILTEEKYQDLKALLDQKVEEFNQPNFIENDPISIPHGYSNPRDIEVAGFFASILAWGQRKTIINKCRELMERMDHAPWDFVKNHREVDLKALLGFKHRTFNDTDLLYFVEFLHRHYQQFDSLEDAFTIGKPVSEFNPAFIEVTTQTSGISNPSFEWTESLEGASPVCYFNHCVFPNGDQTTYSLETGLNNFRSYFFSIPEYPIRTRKHISSPAQNSTCKRLNMFLRWMVRKDANGVDFGIWNKIKMSELICPFDIHVERVARALGLIDRKQVNWRTALLLTETLKKMDPIDPIKYDFALFGMGVSGEIVEQKLS